MECAVQASLSSVTSLIVIAKRQDDMEEKLMDSEHLSAGKKKLFPTHNIPCFNPIVVGLSDMSFFGLGWGMKMMIDYIKYHYPAQYLYKILQFCYFSCEN